jgi:hypothetical protein
MCGTDRTDSKSELQTPTPGRTRSPERLLLAWARVLGHLQWPGILVAVAQERPV